MPERNTDLTPEELETLIRLGKRAISAPAAVRKSLQARGVFVSPANKTSNIPLVQEIEASFESGIPDGPYHAPSIFDPGLMDEFLTDIARYAGEFDPPADGDRARPDGFFWNNPGFSWSDAMVYYCVLRHFQPRQVIEIGSGFSTLVALAALDRNGTGDLLCIDPAPPPWLTNRVTVIEKPVQTIDPDYFCRRLSHEADILFIDSSHTVKTGSDCLHLYLRVIPAIRANIMVHAHDIYLPFPMPMQHGLDRQIYWTEQYLLYAYLLDNPRARVLYGSFYHAKFNKPALTKLMRGRKAAGGTSLWFKLLGGRAPLAGVPRVEVLDGGDQ